MDDVTLKDAATATKARNALVLVRGKPVDELPGLEKALRPIAYAAGWPDDEAAEFLENYLRDTPREGGRDEGLRRIILGENFVGTVGNVHAKVLRLAATIVGWALTVAVALAIWLHYSASRGDLTLYLTSAVLPAGLGAGGGAVLYGAILIPLIPTVAVILGLL